MKTLEKLLIAAGYETATYFNKTKIRASKKSEARDIYICIRKSAGRYEIEVSDVCDFFAKETSYSVKSLKEAIEILPL